MSDPLHRTFSAYSYLSLTSASLHAIMTSLIVTTNKPINRGSALESCLRPNTPDYWIDRCHCPNPCPSPRLNWKVFAEPPTPPQAPGAFEPPLFGVGVPNSQ